MIRSFVTSRRADLEATKADLLTTNARLDAQDVLLALKAPISNPTILTSAVLPADTTIGTVSAADIFTLVNVTSDIQAQLDAKAPLASPTLTGVPAAPTAAPGTSTTQLASTAFVAAAVTAGTGALTASGIANVPAGGIAATNVQTALNELDTEKAPLASPTFTGTTTVQTLTVGLGAGAVATNTVVGFQALLNNTTGANNNAAGR